ncbi:MAG TPA: hypothetical protein VM009_03350 [Terriglobales bacterium]|nr:hypothetical protein [Terriglobales bacterium]
MSISRMDFSTKKILFLLVMAALGISTLTAQTLADRARELRKDKRTPSANGKVFTNETLNLRPAPSIGDPKDAKATDTKADPKGETDEDAPPKATPEEEKAALAADLKGKIESAKAELATVQRELDIASREEKLRIAQYYADAGNRLRDERRFADEQRKTQQDIVDKQKKVAAATALIENLRNQARRAGIPPGLIP